MGPWQIYRLPWKKVITDHYPIEADWWAGVKVILQISQRAQWLLVTVKERAGAGGRGREQRTQKINPDGKWKVEKYPPIRVKNKQKIFKATLQNFRTVQMKIRSSKLLGSGRVHIKRTKISNKSMDPHWYLLVTSITESDILCLLKITYHPCGILPTFHLSKNTHTHRILSSL